ncbi:uncharacterized protein B0J16DRAFT_197615 [Fusarium flagelliforme]|uniref:uncharacterized protein n=1 Tax=Fusarium flagelliforme TaxID=2675880 RepID=UPI001E8E973D|nr:uncharacterized protein B0J16DRAFT_197615 [Fusarium flagelliforme]KAH7173794.1 hypothetical protein B0J16DRAFT_197615 [Fusarium flagelliforme]
MLPLVVHMLPILQRSHAARNLHIKPRIVTGGQTCFSGDEFRDAFKLICQSRSSQRLLPIACSLQTPSHVIGNSIPLIHSQRNHIQYNSPHRSKCLLSGTRTRFFHLRSAVISRHSSFPILSLRTASSGSTLSYVGIHVRSSNNPLRICKRHASSIKCEISRLPQDGPTLLHV